MKPGCSQTDVCASAKDTINLHTFRDAGSAPPPLHEEGCHVWCTWSEKCWQFAAVHLKLILPVEEDLWIMVTWPLGPWCSCNQHICSLWLTVISVTQLSLFLPLQTSFCLCLYRPSHWDSQERADLDQHVQRTIKETAKQSNSCVRITGSYSF